jgi:hypothetical protein
MNPQELVKTPPALAAWSLNFDLNVPGDLVRLKLNMAEASGVEANLVEPIVGRN